MTAPERRRWPRLAHALTVDLVFLGGWLYPLWKDRAVAGLGLAVLLLNGSLLLGRGGWLVRLDERLRGSRRGPALLLSISTLIVALGGLELAAQVLTRAGLLPRYTAMETMLQPGTDDWRMAHITADRFREPDPVLLWRPVARAPYTRQRFKGPILAEPKPAGVMRIFCYGDSNTDGPREGGWPGQLARLLASLPGAVRYEVVNAGVTGYSSHQGLLRFRQDVARYRPDLVFVSFGWNDAAPAAGPPDAEFRPPPAPVVALERFLLRYRWFLAVKAALARPPAAGATTPGPRVDLPAYVGNLGGFLATAREHGVSIVVLTRPHRLPAAELARPEQGWRSRVPAYNRALLAFGRESGATVLDVAGEFARHPELFADECHFDDAGRRHMAEFLARGLEQAGLLTQ